MKLSWGFAGEALCIELRDRPATNDILVK